MKDKLTWFKFSPSDWMMGRISLFDNETQGAFLKLCCIYWNKQGDLTCEYATQILSEGTYTELERCGVFECLESQIAIHFLDEQMGDIQELRKKASEAGKRSAQSRSGQRTLNEPSTTVERNPTEKSRVEKSRVDNKKNTSLGSTKKRFSPPEEKEVVDLFTELGRADLAQKFYLHYQTNGWMVGKNKMKSWESAVKQWVAREKIEPVQTKKLWE